MLNFQWQSLHRSAQIEVSQTNHGPKSMETKSTKTGLQKNGLAEHNHQALDYIHRILKMAMPCRTFDAG